MKDLHYEWSLKEVKFTKDKGTVFSCFACGGGSSMGYKLAGFDVIGCNEIDPKMMEVYKLNHNPKYSYLEGIQTFKNRDDLPEELYNLDILDGSPPCSSFSMCGSREKDWGKEKKFREGQAEQVLDTLFFDFIDLAEKLKPKIVIAENVKGLIQGNAKSYVDRILKAFNKAGYNVGLKLLNASDMGVPQKRERVFFYAIREDLLSNIETIDLFANEPLLNLDFNEKKIKYKEIEEKNTKDVHVFPILQKLLPIAKEGQNLSEIHEKGNMFNYNKAHRDKVLPTITAHLNGGGTYHYKVLRPLSSEELIKAGSFPSDYNFNGINPKYLIGMSVPPLMVARIANEVYKQWISKFDQINEL